MGSASLRAGGDNTSHPHWLTWAPVPSPRPDFHTPRSFGTLEFECYRGAAGSGFAPEKGEGGAVACSYRIARHRPEPIKNPGYGVAGTRGNITAQFT